MPSNVQPQVFRNRANIYAITRSGREPRKGCDPDKNGSQHSNVLCGVLSSEYIYSKSGSHLYKKAPRFDRNWSPLLARCAKGSLREDTWRASARWRASRDSAEPRFSAEDPGSGALRDALLRRGHGRHRAVQQMRRFEYLQKERRPVPLLVAALACSERVLPRPSKRTVSVGPRGNIRAVAQSIT